MNENNLEEIPQGSKRIYFARISGDIIRNYYKKKIKQQFSFTEVYKDGCEQIIDSYFMNNIRHRLELEKNSDETFTITSIEKIKYIGFSLPGI